MQEVIDQQIQGQEVTVGSIKTDDEDKAIANNINTMINRLFHKPKDTNVLPTNSSKALIANLPMTPPIGLTNLNGIQRRTDLVDNDKDVWGDVDNGDQAVPKPHYRTDV